MKRFPRRPVRTGVVAGAISRRINPGEKGRAVLLSVKRTVSNVAVPATANGHHRPACLTGHSIRADRRDETSRSGLAVLASMCT